MTAYVYTSGGFPASPVAGDTLTINSAQYSWNGTTWIATAVAAGPTGATGTTGPAGAVGAQGSAGNDGADSTVAGPAGATGSAGAAGPTGSQGVQGIQGTAGLGINFLGQVATTSNLPSGSNTQGDAYIVQADDSFHVWDGTSAWVSGGSIQGPQGVQGIQGIQGTTGTTGAAGASGSDGSDGADSTVAGPTGPTGAAGTSALVLISQSTAPTSPALGQQWFDTSQGILYQFLTDGTDGAWLDLGAVNSTLSTSAEDAEILALIGL